MKVTIRTKFNWAVFNTETKFRLTEYAIKSRAIYDMQCILRDQPELKGKIAIKQKSFEE
jgi:hypothetical protein